MKTSATDRTAGKHRLSSLKSLSSGVAVLGLAMCPLAANATSFSGDDWTVDIGGFANAYYTTVSCNGDAVGGTALAGRALGCGGQQNRTTIGNGLLPDALTTKFSTQQQGIDITAQVSLMAAVATSDALSANSGVDVRQAFFTLGTPDFGTVKLGRDYGVFGSNATLSDMTLIGVGAPVQATQRGRVSLGHIGAGYTYLGNYGQIVYTTPGTTGLSFTGGVFSPVNNTGIYDSRSAPQVQLQVSYTDGGFKGWIGAKSQRFYAPTGSGVQPDSFTMTAAEIGASYKIGRFGLLGNVQSGHGIGILTDGDQGNAKATNYLLQGTFQLTDKLKLGLNGGISRNQDDLASTANFKSNSNVTAGVYYALTKSVTLSFELSQTRSKDFAGNTARMNGASIGGFVFF
ncbi:porin [Rhodanobacter sp. UC4437_H4]|jgi:predicted porin